MKTLTCKSCGATILWAITAKTGSRMPLDAEPIATSDRPEDRRSLFALIKSTGDTPIAVTPGWFVAELDAPIAYYASHFSTCPQAATHRKVA